MEVTVEAVRHRVGATVTPTPFFNPPRKQHAAEGQTTLSMHLTVVVPTFSRP